MDTVLFDLDGTLLPMNQNAFVERYLGLLGKRAAMHGYQPQPLISALWHGTGEMMKNDGSASNHRRFWDHFAAELGEDIRAMEPVFDEFYAQEFDQARDATHENPLAREAVNTLRQKGYTVALATNPLFPPVAVDTRLAWLGLKRTDFAHITDYRNSHYCKPHSGYFMAVLDKLGKQPADCLMVGNSITEDLAALDVGMQAYLVTDFVEGQGDYADVPHGSFAEFMEYVRQLPEIK